MNELEVGDKVWVQVNVFDVVGESVLVCGNADKSWWVHKRDCKLVEPEAVEQPTKRELTEAQKLAERTLKAIWATQEQPAEPPQRSQDFRYLDKGERILASDVPVVPQVQQVWNQAEPEAVETVGPKTICVGEHVTWPRTYGIHAQWCVTTQRFCFLHENGSSIWVGESELSPMEPLKPNPVEATPQRPFQVGDLVEVCNPHLGTHGHRGVVTEILPDQGVRIHINNGYLVLSYKSLLLVKPTEPETKQPITTATHYGPDISRVSFRFTQDPNTLGTTSEYGDSSEDLTVECEYQLPGEEPFFVIRSTSGWSFDEPETLLALLNSVKDAEKKCRCSLPQS
jgi:hypothetical protein